MEFIAGIDSRWPKTPTSWRELGNLSLATLGSAFMAVGCFLMLPGSLAVCLGVYLRKFDAAG